MPASDDDLPSTSERAHRDPEPRAEAQDAGIPARSEMTEDERAKALAKDDDRAMARGRLL
jgi:hypothetical protein